MGVNKDKYLVHGETYKRLYKEYKKHGTLVIGVDFDGTIHDYHQEGYSYDGCKDLLRDLKAIGCRIICWTAYRDHEYVEKYFKENNLPLDGINCDGVALPYSSRKPFFNALLDDRAGIRGVYNDLYKLVSQIKFEEKHKDVSILNKVSDDFLKLDDKVNILIYVCDVDGGSDFYDMVYESFNNKINDNRSEYNYANIGLKLVDKTYIEGLTKNTIENEGKTKHSDVIFILKDNEISMSTVLLNYTTELFLYSENEKNKKLAQTINIEMVTNLEDLIDELASEIEFMLF